MEETVKTPGVKAMAVAKMRSLPEGMGASSSGSILIVVFCGNDQTFLLIHQGGSTEIRVKTSTITECGGYQV